MRKLKLLLLGGLLLLAQFLSAQNREVTGKVTGFEGAPVNGATVKVKNQRVGTSAGVDGTFKIMIAKNGVLVISAIGYETKEVNTGNESSMVIQLVVDAKGMSEVVVTGTGAATSKRKLAIAVESVTPDKVPTPPTADVGQLLVGRIPGAQISSINGNPGQEAQILLRGINTLRSGTKPMVLLDGIEVKATDLISLDLSSVEKIEVIQGAASATLYGAQGANGVIQLFSKKGKAGKVNIDVSSSVSFNSLLNNGDLHKARFHSLQTDGSGNVVGPGPTSGTFVPLAFDPDLSHYELNVIWNSLDPTNSNTKAYDKNLSYYDHFKMFFQNAPYYNNSISINGARDKFDFSVGVSSTRQESVFKGNGKYARTNFTANVGIELAKDMKLRSITQLVYTDNTLVDESGRTIFYALNNSRPFANYEFKSPDGNYGAYFGDGVGVNGYNPNYMFQYGHPDNNKIDVIQTFNWNYKFLRYFEADVKYGMNYQNDETRFNIDGQDNNLNADYWAYWLEYYPPRFSAGQPQLNTETGEMNITTFKTTFRNFIPSMTVRLDFERDFGLNIPIKSTTYGAFDYRRNRVNAFITYGLNAPPFTPYTMKDMETQKILTDTKTPFVSYGYLFDQKFDYGEIAGVAGGFRTDYSSAFGRGSEPFTFPHFNGYLRVSEFDFWKNGKIGERISELKLRGAFGKAGIQPGPFDRYVTLTPQSMGDNVSFVFKTENPNPSLNVEVSRETEIGTDMTIKGSSGNWFKNFGFSATYWDRRTDNAIWPTDAPPSSGTGSIIDNAFGLKSSGFQAQLSTAAYTSRKLNWTFTTNFSKQSSEITFVKDKPIVILTSAGSSGYQLEAGKKIGQLFGYMMLHSVDQINPATGQPYIDKNDQANFVVASNGWVVYANGPNFKQPYVTPSQYSFGDPNPKFNMSFINDLNYDNWLNFSMQWDWVNGSHLYNQTKEWMYRDGIHGDYDNSITIGSETGAWTAFYRGVYAQVSRNGTKNYFYEDASFMRLRNIALAVDFSRFIGVKGINKMQLVLSGRNLVTFTKYTGMDPEISSGTLNSAWDRGVDHNSIPNIKSWQVSLNLGF